MLREVGVTRVTLSIPVADILPTPAEQPVTPEELEAARVILNPAAAQEAKVGRAEEAITSEAPATASGPAKGGQDEQRWLIERFVNGRHEWLAGWADVDRPFFPAAEVWTFNANDAIGFCRKQDAEAVAKREGWNYGVKVTSHLFIGEAAPSQEGRPSTELERWQSEAGVKTKPPADRREKLAGGLP